MLASYARLQYEQMQVQTTSGRLIVMLYDGAIRFLSKGAEAMRTGDTTAQTASLGKAQDIICHLVSTVDLAAGPIAEDLLRIYHYCASRVLTAHSQNNPEGVHEVIDLLKSLREGWDQAERSVRSGDRAAGSTAREAW